nr:MAG TPA: hypothetical protein [Caudoviricetes sp.]
MDLHCITLITIKSNSTLGNAYGCFYIAVLVF